MYRLEEIAKIIGGELFGNQTRMGNGDLAANGYDALASLDGNGDGRIDTPAQRGQRRMALT